MVLRFTNCTYHPQLQPITHPVNCFYNQVNITDVTDSRALTLFQFVQLTFSQVKITIQRYFTYDPGGPGHSVQKPSLSETLLFTIHDLANWDVDFTSLTRKPTEISLKLFDLEPPKNATRYAI